jgi:hypothetical protein
MFLPNSKPYITLEMIFMIHTIMGLKQERIIGDIYIQSFWSWDKLFVQLDESCTVKFKVLQK